MSSEVQVQADGIVDLRRRARFWEVHHARAKEREEQLRAEVSELRGEKRRLSKELDRVTAERDAIASELVNLKKQLFGRKSEQRKSTAEIMAGPVTGTDDSSGKKRSRGQQLGSEGHGRTPRPDLATEEVERSIPESQLCCPRCGRSYRIGARTEDSDEYVWIVRVFRRRIKRQVAFKTCDCEDVSLTVTAPPLPKLIPKGQLSIEFWVNVLLDKYLLQRPLSRIRSFLALKGMPLSPGTVAGGLRRIGEVMEPIYTDILERNQSANHWFMDETRWMVFEEIEGKTGHRWWLWVSVSHDTCAFILDPTRSATVPLDHLKGDAEMLPAGILNCDRYSSYKSLANTEGSRIVLAYCWAHVRRDFDKAGRGHTRLVGWGEQWIDLIGVLYDLNDSRVKHWIPPVGSEPATQSEAFLLKDGVLRAHVAAMAERRDAELEKLPADSRQTASSEAKRKVLESLTTHWDGLNVFVDHPEIPMDNNTAERALRDAAVGRKVYYGSGSVWAGRLTAVLLTVFKTLLMNRINPEHWLFAYLTACAENGGKVPEKASEFLPWNLSEERKTEWYYDARGP